MTTTVTAPATSTAADAVGHDTGPDGLPVGLVEGLGVLENGIQEEDEGADGEEGEGEEEEGGGEADAEVDGEADHDDDQEAGKLDAGEYHVHFHALADATEIHDGDECHEEKAGERNAEAFKPEAEAVREVGCKGS